ncbi:hypothetical protein LSO9J_260010 [Candidatus Liberibacter solanacearum]
MALTPLFDLSQLFFGLLFIPYIYFVKEGIITINPLLLLAPFTQEIIAGILGFWYTDKVVQKKRG